jgi:hypothetical protein
MPINEWDMNFVLSISPAKSPICITPLNLAKPPQLKNPRHKWIDHHLRLMGNSVISSLVSIASTD